MATAVPLIPPLGQSARALAVVLRCLGARLKPGVLRRAAGAVDEGAVTLRVALGAADGPPTAAELVRRIEHEQPTRRALLESLRVPAVIGGAAAGSQLLEGLT